MLAPDKTPTLGIRFQIGNTDLLPRRVRLRHVDHTLEECRSWRLRHGVDQDLFSSVDAWPKEDRLMLSGFETLGIRFDVNKMTSGDYGEECWKLVWSVVTPKQLPGAFLWEGDTAATLKRHENV